MKNTDLVTFVGYSKGGKGVYGEFGAKVRFAIDKTRRTKELFALGASDVYFIALPNPMTKADAVLFLEKSTDTAVSEQIVQEAISRAHTRLVPRI